MIFVISLLTLIIIIAPVSLFFHEMGHVVGASMMNATSVRLTVGVGKNIWQSNVKNVHIIIRSVFIMNSFTSTVRDKPFSNVEKIVITLMGPLFSGLLATMLYLIHVGLVQSNLIYIFFLFNVWLVLINLIPFKVGQKQSDGYTICTLIWQNRLKRREQ